MLQGYWWDHDCHVYTQADFSMGLGKVESWQSPLGLALAVAPWTDTVPSIFMSFIDFP